MCECLSVQHLISHEWNCLYDARPRKIAVNHFHVFQQFCRCRCVGTIIQWKLHFIVLRAMRDLNIYFSSLLFPFVCLFVFVLKEIKKTFNDYFTRSVNINLRFHFDGTIIEAAAATAVAQNKCHKKTNWIRAFISCGTFFLLFFPIVKFRCVSASNKHYQLFREKKKKNKNFQKKNSSKFMRLLEMSFRWIKLNIIIIIVIVVLCELGTSKSKSHQWPQ